MDDLRVAVVIHGYYPRVGGAERQMQALAPRLLVRGIDLHILTRRYPSTLPPYEKLDNVPLYRLPAPWNKLTASLIFSFAAFFKLIRLRPQVIHAHEFLSTATAAMLAERWLRVPVVLTLHRSGPIGDVQKLKRKFLGKERLNTYCRRTSAFVVISNEIKEELESVGVSQQKMAMISNGVDTQLFAPPSQDEKAALRARIGFSPDALLVVYSGRLVPEKRVDILLEVWPRIMERSPGAEILILGTGPEETKLRNMAGAGAHFLGNVEDVSLFLKAADVFALPSSAEGLSVAMLEAMACGLPVVVTAVGGSVEVITHDENGWLVPPDSLSDLQTGLETLLQDAGRRARLGRAARMRILDDYSLDGAVDKLVSLYSRLSGVKVL